MQYLSVRMSMLPRSPAADDPAEVCADNTTAKKSVRKQSQVGRQRLLHAPLSVLLPKIWSRPESSPPLQERSKQTAAVDIVSSHQRDKRSDGGIEATLTEFDRELLLQLHSDEPVPQTLLHAGPRLSVILEVVSLPQHNALGRARRDDQRAVRVHAVQRVAEPSGQLRVLRQARRERGRRMSSKPCVRAITHEQRRVGQAVSIQAKTFVPSCRGRTTETRSCEALGVQCARPVREVTSRPRQASRTLDNRSRAAPLCRRGTFRSGTSRDAQPPTADTLLQRRRSDSRSVEAGAHRETAETCGRI
jgi:hypothetical protein